MTIESYDNAGPLVGMIKACECIMLDYDSDLGVEFKIQTVKFGKPITTIELSGSGAQMLYNAINYTKNKLVKELEEL